MTKIAPPDGRKGPPVGWIGAKGRWIEDNSVCTIIGVVDEGAGVYEFTYVEPVPEDVDGDLLTWIGFLDEFAWDGE